jgi:hypothetical protein
MDAPMPIVVILFFLALGAAALWAITFTFRDELAQLQEEREQREQRSAELAGVSALLAEIDSAAQRESVPVAKEARSGKRKVAKPEAVKVPKERKQGAFHPQLGRLANAAGVVKTNVAGVTFRNVDRKSRQKLIRERCMAGQPVTLKREPDNKYDRNAIAVSIEGGLYQIGSLHSDVAAKLAPLLDAGHKFKAEVLDVLGGTEDKPTFGVLLSIELR